MNSAFGEIFLFLTNLAWKSRMTIPVLVTTVFLIMDVRLQIEINIQSGQVAAAELQQLDDSDDDDEPDDDEADHDLDEDTSEDSNEHEHDLIFDCDIGDDGDEEDDDDNAANRIRRSLGLS